MFLNFCSQLSNLNCETNGPTLISTKETFVITVFGLQPVLHPEYHIYCCSTCSAC